MGSGFSRLFPCLNQSNKPDVIFTPSDDPFPLDETLGHSFCYVRSSARFLSPSHSDRLSPSQSLRETAFRAISGASVSANTSTPRTVLQHDLIYDDPTTTTADFGYNNNGFGFESSANFSALPLQLQPIPRGAGAGPDEKGFLFMSGPIERGAVSGPLDLSSNLDDGVHFSAPLHGGVYVKKRRRKAFSGIRKAFPKRPWVVPVRHRRLGSGSGQNFTQEVGREEEDSVQWAHGKAGEDRVHVVVSEELGWLFVGIYDGFNGPDAPEFLMGNLYRAVFNELQGLFWDVLDNCSMCDQVNDVDVHNSSIGVQKNLKENESQPNVVKDSVCLEENERKVEGISLSAVGNGREVVEGGGELEMDLDPPVLDRGTVKRVTFEAEKTEVRRKLLWEFLAEENAEEGLDLSGSDRFAFSVDDAVRISNVGSTVKKRSLLLSKLKHGFSKYRDGQGHSKRFFPWMYEWEEKEKPDAENRVGESICQSLKKRRVGFVDHELVLGALSRALDVTELAYLDMTDKVLDRNPELALMGSCLLVVLMRDEDVYVMNVGDSRAIVAQYEPCEISSSTKATGQGSNRLDLEGIVEESGGIGGGLNLVVTEASAEEMKLTALQLSTDHSTSIEEEVLRIKQEHPDDNQCIVNDRVKGRLKVTRAFGAGFLKQPKLNDALLEMFRNEYIGTAPYISCSPSLCHHKLGPNDQFLILSSDGLYQYLSNEEVVSHVESFMEKFPDGDPAQHLIEELLFRAAKKAGMGFHELLDIPQGDRRKYHDDVTVMVISLEGRIWKSSGKYL